LSFTAAVANNNVHVSNHRLPDTGPADGDRESSERSGTSTESSTSSSASADSDPPREPSSSGAAAERAEVAGGSERPASAGAETDATCDTVSATMWFDRPEVATSFVNCDVSDDDDDDADSVNNDHRREDGKTPNTVSLLVIQTDSRRL